MDRFLNASLNTLIEARNSVKFLFFLGLTFVLRFPFFFRDYIDRDESTFILVGQSLANGQLPYTELWDLKPPIIFYLLGAVIKVFGQSFIAIRFTAVLTVALLALITFLIARRLSTDKWALLAGILTVYLCSLFGSVQGLMSEHVSTLFFMLGLYLLMRNQSLWNYVFVGLLLGVSVMTKTNTAYALLLLFLVIPYQMDFKLPSFLHVGLLGFGILFSIAICAAPYYLSGQTTIWLDAVYHAPLAYTQTKGTGFLKVIPLGLVIALFLVWSWRTAKLDFRSREVQLLVLMLLGIVFSFFRIGKINGHYLIQIYPILLILLVATFSGIKMPRPTWTSWVILAIFFLAPMESYLEGLAIIRHKKEKGTWYNGEGVRVPYYLKQNGLSDQQVFFLEYHIGYWILGQKPPTKAATHPSNICRPELFPYYNPARQTGLEEIQYIMEVIQPEIVVVRANKLVFNKAHMEENNYIDRYLKTRYTVLQEVDNALLLKRLHSP